MQERSKLRHIRSKIAMLTAMTMGCTMLPVFVKRNWSQNALENGSTLSQKFMTI